MGVGPAGGPQYGHTQRYDLEAALVNRDTDSNRFGIGVQVAENESGMSPVKPVGPAA